jgi:hypothetical protein
MAVFLGRKSYAVLVGFTMSVVASAGYTPAMHSFVKSVAAISAMMFVGFAYGAWVGARSSVGPWPFAIGCAAIGAVEAIFVPDDDQDRNG